MSKIVMIGCEAMTSGNEGLWLDANDVTLKSETPLVDESQKLLWLAVNLWHQGKKACDWMPDSYANLCKINKGYNNFFYLIFWLIDRSIICIWKLSSISYNYVLTTAQILTLLCKFMQKSSRLKKTFLSQFVAFE